MSLICVKCAKEKYLLVMENVSNGWTPRYSKGVAKINIKEHQYLKRNFKNYAKLFDERASRKRNEKGRYE